MRSAPAAASWCCSSIATALVGAVALVVLPSGSAALWVLAAPAFLALSYFVLQGPKWCLAAIIGSVVFGLSNSSVAAGGLDLRVTDFFYVVLGVWVVVLRARDGQRGYLVGRRMLGCWLLAHRVLALPAVRAGHRRPRRRSSRGSASPRPSASCGSCRTRCGRCEDFEFTLARWRSPRPIRWVLRRRSNIAQGKLAERLSGANSPNSTGMLAVLLIVLALHGPVPRHRSPPLDHADRRRDRAPDDEIARVHRRCGHRARLLRATRRVPSRRPVESRPAHAVPDPDHARGRSRGGDGCSDRRTCRAPRASGTARPSTA